MQPGLVAGNKELEGTGRFKRERGIMAEASGVAKSLIQLSLGATGRLPDKQAAFPGHSK